MNDVINIINQNIGNVFSNITFIDIALDEVRFLEYKNTIEVKEVNNYEQYYEKLKKVIHPDYLNKYFDAISLNNLDPIDYKTIKYSKLSSNLSYDNYIDIIKKVGDNQIIILTFKCDADNNNAVSSDDLSSVVADLIVGIESIIGNIKTDSHEVNNAIRYIDELLNEVKSQNKKVLANYAEKITLEVNKTHESLLIIDDDALTRNIFKKVFEKDFNIIEAKNGAEAVEIIENNIVKASEENIVGMFLDLKMPIMDGFGVLNYLTDKKIINKMPVIIISADDAKETKEEVYKYDIADMLEKPFNYELIKKRVINMVRMYAKGNVLNSLVKNSQTKLKQLLNRYVESYLIDYSKTYKIASDALLKVLPKYNEIATEKIDLNLIIDAMKYYDVAINTVPRSYLNNVNNLSSEERSVIANYPKLSNEIISIIAENQSDNYINYAKKIAVLHNERYDGLGFPNNLKQDAIPNYIYLINIALDYASLKNSQKNNEEIKNTLLSKSGSKYSPDMVSLFISVMEEL